MPITRTPIIDDDGSGQTGTVIDNAWKQELYGQIDGALAQPLAAPLRLSGLLGVSLTLAAYNNFQPVNGAQNVVWFLGPTVSTAITGILAEADGTQHLLINTTGTPILFANAHANSSAANRLICPGYGDYTLGTWASIWAIYSTFFQSWILQKAT